MTLRDKVRIMEPYKISEIRYGGVEGCPADYGYLNSNINSKTCECKLGIKLSELDRICFKCWNKEFKGEEDEK